MNDTPDFRTVVVEALAGIAPDVDPATLDPSGNLQDQAGLDSMDILNLVTAIHERTGIDIPERDYPNLESIDSMVAYLEAASVSS